jgi:hypothetical protein
MGEPRLSGSLLVESEKGKDGIKGENSAFIIV